MTGPLTSFTKTRDGWMNGWQRYVYLLDAYYLSFQQVVPIITSAGWFIPSAAEFLCLSFNRSFENSNIQNRPASAVAASRHQLSPSFEFNSVRIFFSFFFFTGFFFIESLPPRVINLLLCGMRASELIVIWLISCHGSGCHHFTISLFYICIYGGGKYQNEKKKKKSVIIARTGLAGADNPGGWISSAAADTGNGV